MGAQTAFGQKIPFDNYASTATAVVLASATVTTPENGTGLPDANSANLNIYTVLGAATATLQLKFLSATNPSLPLPNGTKVYIRIDGSLSNALLGVLLGGTGDVAAYTGATGASTTVISGSSTTATLSGFTGADTYKYVLVTTNTATVNSVVFKIDGSLLLGGGNLLVYHGFYIAPPTVNPFSVCLGSSVGLTMTNPQAGYTYNWYASNGTTLLQSSTSPTYTVSPTVNTTYYVEAVETNAGQSFSSIKVPVTVTVNPQPSLATIPAQSICNGQSINLTTLNPVDQAGTTGGTYTWSATQGGAALGSTTVTPGVGTVTYWVRYNKSGCISDQSVTITVKPQPSLANIPAQSLCNGQSLNLTTLNPTDQTGTTGGTYTWSATQGGAALSSTTVTPGVGTTTYWVRYTLNGCFSDKSVAVTVNIQPSLANIPAQTLCNGQSLNLTTLNPADQNGSTGGTYVWSATQGGTALGSTTVSPGVGTTTYWVRYTRNGCFSDKSVTVTVNIQPSLAVIPAQTLCNGQSLNLTTLNPADQNGTTGGTYVWSATQGGTALGSTTVSPGVGTTTYWVRYTINGCFADRSVAVTVNVQPSLANIPAQTLCNGQSLNLTTLNPADQNGTTTGTYTWSATQGGAALGSTTVTPGVGTTTYWVRYTLNGCFSDKSVTVTVNIQPSLAVIPAQSLCNGQSLNLTTLNPADQNGTTTGTYTWSATQGGTALGSTTVSPAVGTTTYWVRYTINGCFADRSVAVTVNIQPSLANIPAQTLCNGQSLNLTTLNPADQNGTTGGTYVWSATQGGTALSSTTVSPAVGTTTYWVRYTRNGCFSDKSVTVTVNVQPALAVIPAQSLCNGQSLNLTTLNPADQSGTTGGTYIWSATQGGAALGSTTVSPGVGTTTYWVRYTINGCFADRSVTVTVNIQPSLANIPAQTLCNGQSLNLTTLNPADQNGTTTGTYVWSATQGGAALGSTTVTPGVGTTTYWVRYTINGCFSDKSVTVTVNVQPSLAAIPPQTLCNGQSLNLTTLNPADQNGTTGGTYVWSATQGGAALGSTTVSPGVGTTTYWVRYTINGCFADRSVTVTVNIQPSLANIPAQTLCNGQSLNLTTLNPADQNGSTGGTYVWSATQGGAALGSTIVTPSVGTTTYWVRYTANGCFSDKSVTVTVNTQPSLAVIPAQTLCNGQSLNLTTLNPADQNGTTGGTYVWSATQGGAALGSTTVTPGVGTTTYWVRYTINGCFADRSVTVTVNIQPSLANIPPQTLCAGQSLNLTTLNPADQNGSTGGTYVWSVTQGGTALSSTTVTPGVGTTTYWVRYTSNGCFSDKSVTVTVNPVPVLTSSVSTLVCSGTPFSYTATSNLGGTTFSWTRAAVTGISNTATSGSSNQINETLINTTNATINVTYVFTLTANGCSSVTNVVLKVYPKPGAPHIVSH